MKVNKVILNKKIAILLVATSLFFSACMKETTTPTPTPSPKTIEVKAPIIEENIDTEVEIELTPLEMCEKEENKYNI